MCQVARKLLYRKVVLAGHHQVIDVPHHCDLVTLFCHLICHTWIKRIDHKPVRLKIVSGLSVEHQSNHFE